MSPSPGIRGIRDSRFMIHDNCSTDLNHHVLGARSSCRPWSTGWTLRGQVEGMGRRNKLPPQAVQSKGFLPPKSVDRAGRGDGKIIWNQVLLFHCSALHPKVDTRWTRRPTMVRGLIIYSIEDPHLYDLEYGSCAQRNHPAARLVSYETHPGQISIPFTVSHSCFPSSLCSFGCECLCLHVGQLLECYGGGRAFESKRNGMVPRLVAYRVRRVKRMKYTA